MRYEFSKSGYATPLENAVKNLTGLTHYVDSDTLRYFRSRIVACDIHDNGRLLSIIESLSLDCNHTSRGFRHVVFDVTGQIVSRVKLEDCLKSKNAARKAMYAFLDSIDAKKLTREALLREKNRIISDISEALKRNAKFK